MTTPVTDLGPLYAVESGGREAGTGPSPSGPGVLRREFVHEREPRADWLAALREVSVLTDAHGTLELVWEPGDPWIPGQRWTLWETVAPDTVDYELLRALRGPNPRSEGHMCSSQTVPGQFQCLCKTKLEGWRGSPNEGVTLTQWKLFRRTGRVGRMFWIIQGRNGGHKAFLTQQEVDWLRAEGKKHELPAIGTLPYAEFDSRVVQHIVRFNRLRQMGGSLARYRKTMSPDGYRAYVARIQKEQRRQLVAWLDEQTREDMDLWQRAAGKGEIDNHAPRTEVDWEKVEEASTANYIETGQLLHPSKVKGAIKNP